MAADGDDTEKSEGSPSKKGGQKIRGSVGDSGRK